jgi:hypothetical protein
VDRITKSLIEAFLKEHEIESEGEAIDFEKFCNYCVISREYPETFKVEDVSVGSSNDTGLDGIAIIVNGKLVDSIEEVDDLADINKRMEATFIFIQSKTSNTFDSGDMLKFFEGVSDFFAEEEPVLERNEMVEYKAKIATHIYSKSSMMLRGRPLCKMYYITTGKWTDDKNLVRRMSAKKHEIEDKNIFEKVEIQALGADEIRKLYQSTKLALSTDIIFASRVVLPEISGISESYIGTLPFSEFRKLIVDEFDNIRLSIFYDNIRAFQGSNDVNHDIESTLKSGELDRFSVLNNGITIIAKSLDTVGNRFNIRDYQIVNGCQTSHVLFNCRNLSGINNLQIPVKIIVTDKDDVINSIIKATNHQTPVKKEELAALSEFQKKLEQCYNSFESFHAGEQLYYERRSKQYHDRADVPKNRVITIPDQIKTFAAMFLDQPHRVSRSYGDLSREIGSKIFGANHSPTSYYVSAFAYYRLENLFNQRNRNKLDPKYKKCKYYLLMAMRYLTAGADMPSLDNQRKMEQYCNKIISVLNSQQKYLQVFEKGTEIIEEQFLHLNINIDNRDVITTVSFVEQLKKRLESEFSKINSK